MKSVRLVLVFRFIISALFIFSAIAKLLSLPFFDGMVAELFLGKDYFNQPTGMFWMQLFTRTLIAGELLLGLAVLQGKYLKLLVLPAIFFMLAIFTMHLFFAATVLGKGFIGGNCGCFGDLVPMDNFESIVKNVLSMVMVAYIYKFVNPRRDRINSLTLVLTAGVVTFLTLLLTIKSYKIETPVVDFSNTPVQQTAVMEDTVVSHADSSEVKIVEEKVVVEQNQQETVKQEQPIKAKRLFDDYTQFSNGETVDLYNGDKLICLFSVTCGHCQSTYKDICSLVSSGKLPATYLINYGTALDQEYFFSQAGGKHPHILEGDYGKFKRLLQGNDFPRVIYMKNGEIVQEWNLETYNKSSFSQYFGIKEKKENNGGLELNLPQQGDDEGSSLFGDY